MSIILTFLLTFTQTPAETECLRASAPGDLTTESAYANLTAAQVAAVVYQFDRSLLLAIAYRESRYTVASRGPEVQGKHACGLMQPMMHTQRCQSQTLLGGYMEGAKHLREWVDGMACHGNLRCGLLGYAGGYRLINACSKGPFFVERNGGLFNVCLVPDITFARALRIRGVGTS